MMGKKRPLTPAMPLLAIVLILGGCLYTDKKPLAVKIVPSSEVTEVSEVEFQCQPVGGGACLGGNYPPGYENKPRCQNNPAKKCKTINNYCQCVY